MLSSFVPRHSRVPIMDMLKSILICSAVTVVVFALIVLVCVWAKLDELRLSRLTRAGWLLLAVAVVLTIAASFAIGSRFSDVLTYESGKRMWRTPLGFGAGLVAVMLFALGKAALSRLGIRIVRNKAHTGDFPKT